MRFDDTEEKEYFKKLIVGAVNLDFYITCHGYVGQR
jgi:hypothetical protein